jgi:hemoglobin-like flavoprotein
MTERDMERLLDSYDRCLKVPSFLDVFYEHFMGSSPEIAARFERTDFKRQKKVLRASLYDMIQAVGRSESDFVVLDPVARLHDRHHLDVPASMYDLWLESLLFAIRTTDDRCDEETEQVWRDALKQGIAYLVSKH